MGNSLLHAELLKQQFDTAAPPPSYHGGGLADPCRIEPDDLIVFFSGKKNVTRGMQSWCHQRYQLKCTLSPAGNISIDGRNFRLAGDQGIVIFPFQLHQINFSEPPETHNFMTITFLDRGSGRDSLLPLRNHPFSVTKADLVLLDYIVSAYQKRPGYEAGEAVASLRLFLARKLAEVRRTSGAPAGCCDPFIEALTARIRENFDRPLSIKDLALMLSLSESHLRRLTRQHLNGIPLGEYLLHLRLHHADELLLGSTLSIGEIGKKCGYADIHSFSRAFRNHCGITPGEFRRKNKADEPISKVNGGKI